ncbi:NUDIX domain-containing protein [Candidatus Curtissbacteria bacterium]|nr:NUDIX domain-containing protein [Candidatus Curtissbacteria bacterium]
MEQKFPEPTVGALIVNTKGEILLVKSPKWFDKYTIPGGHAELGEDLETALIREVKEEVGLGVKVKKLLNWQEAIYSKEFYKPKHFIFFDYYCTTNNSEVKMDGREIIDFIWIKPEKAIKLKVDSFTRKTIGEYLKLLKH